MLRLGTVVHRVTDMPRAVDFWTRALGYVVRDGSVGEEWTTLVPADGEGVGLSLDRTDEPPPFGRNRKRRRPPSDTIATDVSSGESRAIRSPCHATLSRPSR